MVGVVVISKFITHDNDKKFAGMVDYMDREEAITNDNISLSIKGVELNNIEKKIISLMNKTGSTDINILIKDEKLKNMICFDQKLFDKKDQLTRIEEDKIKNPHRKFIEEKIKDLELKSDEFKREKEIIDEKYSIVNELEYSGMIDYMDRKKAKNNNSKGDICLFTNNKDSLDSTEKKEIKNLFNKCQENGGIMWHDVISFDNKFLEKHGIYDSKNKILDSRKLKEVVRASANEMLKKEKLDNSAIWCADIHYNTDNIHIHVSTVELNPSKERGKRKPKSIFAMKSKVVNGIINNNEQYKKINDIIRENIIAPKKNVKSLDDKELKKLFVEIHSKLPKDRKEWNYNYNTINNVRPLLDKMTDIYIEKYHKEDLLQLKEELKKQEVNLKEAYGEGENESYKKYYDSKLKDLKTRMGNTILKEIKVYDYSLKQQKSKNTLSKTDRKALIRNSIVAINLKKLERILENSSLHFKNQKDYEKLQVKIEMENEK